MAHVVDSGLESMLPSEDHLVYSMLHGLIQHDLYHAGQIALLKHACKQMVWESHWPARARLLSTLS
jgi:hypothetical protein